MRTRDHNILNDNGGFPYTTNVLFSVPCSLTRSAISCDENEGRGLAECYEPPVSTSPTPPPPRTLTNQCKCRSRPGPQLAFQRARTTSRALNKCRCDRQRRPGEGGLTAPHLFRCAGSAPAAVTSRRMGCAPSDSGGQRGNRVSPVARNLAASLLLP